jgi:hypothetical protein
MAWRHFARRSRPPDRHDRRHRRPRRKPVGPPERAASGGTKRRGLDSSPQARLPGRLHATRPHVLGATVPQRLRWPCRQVPEASRRGLVFRQREGRKSLTSTVPRNYRPSSRAPGSPRHRTAQGRRAPASSGESTIWCSHQAPGGRDRSSCRRRSASPIIGSVSARYQAVGVASDLVHQARSSLTRTRSKAG